MKLFGFWLIAVSIVPGLYWFCLRFFFPGYFAPLSAFHVDFYDYAAAGVKPFSILFTRYSRPASFAVAKLLANAGFPVLLFGDIVIALSSVLFTLAFVRRAFRLSASWKTAALFALYVFILFAHPEFYEVHRHDLPAECAYLFLMVSLLSWLSFVSDRDTLRRISRWLLIGVAVLFAALSAFSKETYFLSALCLVAGLAFSNHRDRRTHLSFLLLLVLLDCSSYEWNRLMGWPPANPSSLGGDSYSVSLAPSSLAHTYYFYLSRFLNPALVLLPLIGLAAAWRDRKRLALGFAFLIAGLITYLPHALLPNHLDPQYAWLGAPLFFAPLFLISDAARRTRFTAAAMALATAISAVAVFGSSGYWQAYRSSSARWLVEEDKKGAAVVNSLRRLHEIPQPARILVVGLEDTAIPWEAGDFIRSEFGDRLTWSVVLPESIDYRRGSRLVEFPHAGDVKLENFDRIITYNPSGQLMSVRAVASVPASEPRSEIIVPSLIPLLAQTRAQPSDPTPLLACAQAAAAWGLRTDALNFVVEAKRAGAPGAATEALSAQIRNAIATAAAAPKPSLVARLIHPSQRSGGLSEVDLFWTVPGGVASEIHVNAPNGVLFARSEGSGQARTGQWVRSGMLFFLQDVSGGKPLDAQHTLAQVKVD